MYKCSLSCNILLELILQCLKTNNEMERFTHLSYSFIISIFHFFVIFKMWETPIIQQNINGAIFLRLKLAHIDSKVFNLYVIISNNLFNKIGKNWRLR